MEEKDFNRIAQLIKTEVNAVRSDVGSFKEEMTAVRSDVGSLKEEMTAVRSDVGSLKEEMTSVRSDVGSLKEEMTAVRFDIGRLDGAVTAVRSDVGNLKEEMTAVRSDIGSFKEEIKDDFRLQVGILSEDFHGKLQLVAEGHQMLAEKMDRMHGELTGKIDAVAVDLAAHRIDTEGHKRGYMVQEP